MRPNSPLAACRQSCEYFQWYKSKIVVSKSPPKPLLRSVYLSSWPSSGIRLSHKEKKKLGNQWKPMSNCLTYFKMMLVGKGSFFWVFTLIPINIAAQLNLFTVQQTSSSHVMSIGWESTDPKAPGFTGCGANDISRPSNYRHHLPVQLSTGPSRLSCQQVHSPWHL